MTLPANRCRGLIVPVAEIEGYLACGWTIGDDLRVWVDGKWVALMGAGEIVLMLPPAELVAA